MECRRGLAMTILSVRLSVRLSVDLSVKRVNCDETEEKSLQIFIHRGIGAYENPFSLYSSEKKNGWCGEILVQTAPVRANSPILN